MSAIHHLTLTVKDIEVSKDWYIQLLGPAQIIERASPGWRRFRLTWPSGLIIGISQHDSTTPKDVFSPDRIGLDHIGLTCKSKDEVLNWVKKLDELDIEHGPFEDVAYCWAVTARDPDNIPIEFFCPK